jgi:hypothetical protein
LDKLALRRFVASTSEPKWRRMGGLSGPTERGKDG